jgi:hypothetical protein
MATHVSMIRLLDPGEYDGQRVLIDVMAIFSPDPQL